MDLYADYSGGRPPGSALRAAGFAGVIRYIGVGSAGKRLTGAEYADLRATGLTVAGVVEQATTDADGGYNAGVANARAALADATALGCDPTMPIFAANDKPGYSQADVDYVRGFRDVLGLARTGAYGFGAYLGLCRSQGVASWFWQAGPSPSRTGTDGWVHVWQRNGSSSGDGPGSPTGMIVAGVAVDINNVLIPIGAPAPSADPTITEDEMGYQVEVSGNGDGIVQSVQVPAAGMKYINFSTGFGNQLTLKQVLCFGDTPADPAPATTALAPVHADGSDWTIDNDRPGPVALPAGVRTVSVEFTCDGVATIWTSLV